MFRKPRASPSAFLACSTATAASSLAAFINGSQLFRRKAQIMGIN
jgi:hypothetical protein